MLTILLCAVLTIAYLGVFYIWGGAFLGWIGSERYMADRVAFGFIVMHIVYQVFYLPFFFTRGSYRTLSMIWVVVSAGITLACLIYNARTRSKQRRKRLSIPLAVLALCGAALVVWLCMLVGLHRRPYANDGYYIEHMNQMVNRDIIFIRDGALDYRRGFNSFFALFATPALFTGIRPFYVALFTMRFLAVMLTSVVAYRTGKALLDREQRGVSGYALALSMIVPFAMMFWSSTYTAQFFFMRANESKAYCHLVFLPLAFSVCVEMFLAGADRGVLWKKQLAIGLAAVPVAASALMPYPVMIAIATVALLVYDRFRGAKGTLPRALLCVAPNIAYLVIQSLH